MCQEFPKEKWVDARREDILDAPYFHVVFTVPEELNPIIYSNQKFLYAALYHAASDTLKMCIRDSMKAGYSCTCAFDGMEAADILEERNFDLIIIAVMLPKDVYKRQPMT